MTRDELLKIHSTLCDKAQSLMRRKNADYAGNHGMEPFANFTRTEAMGICTTEKGMLVRMTDKMSRLSSFMEAGEFQVKDESLEDTVLDMINYSVLLWAYLKEKRDGSRKSVATAADIDNGRVFLKEVEHEEAPYHERRSYPRRISDDSVLDAAVGKNGVCCNRRGNHPIDSGNSSGGERRD